MPPRNRRFPQGDPSRRLPGPPGEEDQSLLSRRKPSRVAPRRTATPANRAARIAVTQAGSRQRGTGVALGTSKLPAIAERSYNEWFGAPGSNAIDPQTTIVNRLEAVYDDLTRQYTERESLLQASQEAYAGRIFDKEEEKRKEEEGQKGALEWAFTSTGPGSRVFDIISRPFYGGYEMGRSALEKLHERESEGGDSSVWRSAQDLPEGFWEGFSGRQKTGPGQFYEEFKEGTPVLKGLEEEHPAIEQKIAQGVGFAGEIYGGPGDRLSIPKVGVTRDTGEVLNERTMRQAMQRAVGEEVADYYDAIIAGLPTSQHLPSRDAFVTKVLDSVQDNLNQAELSIQGGGVRGRYQVMNNRMWGQVASATATKEMEAVLTGEFHKLSNDFLESVQSGHTWHEATVQAAMNTNDDFAKFIDILDDELVAEGRIPVGSNLNQIINAVQKGDRKIFDNLQAKIRQNYAGDLDNFSNDVLKRTRNATYQTIGVRFGNKVIPAKAIGRAYHAVDNKITGNREAWVGRSYNSMNPGTMGLKTSRSQTLGIYAMDQYKEKVGQVARQYSKDEANLIQEMADRVGGKFADPRMQAGLDFYKKEMDDMLLEEHASGARHLDNTPRLENYAYVYNKGGGKKLRRDYKVERKSAVKKSGGKDAGPYRMAKARQDKLRPVENAFDALIYRKMKSQRDITRADLRTDMLDAYGFHAPNIADWSRKNRKLHKIAYKDLNEAMRKQIDSIGGSYYLPKEIADYLDNYYKITKWNTAEWDMFTRNFAKVMGIMKTLYTVPNIGFHVKNQIGDFFMGLIDGVKTRTYSEVASKFSLRKAGKHPNFHIIDGWDMLYDDMWAKYQKEGQGGFFSVDEGGSVRTDAKSAVGKAVHKPGAKLRDWSQSREDFGRFTHFIHALRDEAQGLVDKGMTDMAEIQRKASDSALWRVNNYRFDYNALTTWEKTLKTLAFPFYTYARKSIPTMVQSMFMSPKYMNTWNRFMQYHDGSAADHFSNMDVPDYIRNTGAAFLTDEREPLYLSQEAVPVSSLNTIRTNTLQDFAKSIVNQANPFVQAPFELASGKTFFDDREIEDWKEYVLNKMPMYKDVREEVWNPLHGKPTADSWWESVLKNRFAGIGVPVRRLTQGQQELAQNERIDKYIDDPLKEINFQQDTFRVARDPTTGYYEVRSSLVLDENGQNAIVAQFNLPEEAIQFVKENLRNGYERPREYVGINPETGTGQMYPD